MIGRKLAWNEWIMHNSKILSRSQRKKQTHYDNEEQTNKYARQEWVKQIEIC